MRESSKTRPNEGHLDYLPIFLSVAGQEVLVIGGSDGAAAKVRLLLRAGARVRLHCRRLGPEMAELVRSGKVARSGDRVTVESLKGCRLAFDDGEDAIASARLRAEAPGLGLLVNTIDTPRACDFIVPAIVDRSPVVVAVSTGGASPALAKLVRQRVETVLPAGLGRLARALSACRDHVKRTLPGGRARLRFWDAFLTDARFERLSGQPEDAVVAEVEQALAQPEATLDIGEVTLVGAGPGDPGLLSLAAAQALRAADVVLHDALVSPEVLDMVRKEARMVPVGKRAGGAAMPQDMINRLIVTHARRGARVVRLKGGDPFVFGRGGEEQEHLIAHGIRPRVIGGTTAALGIAAGLGIPLTHRGVARSLRLVTGSFLEDRGRAGPDWAALADPATTLCVYMGGRKRRHLAEGLIAGGLAASTPVALVARGTTPEQVSQFTTLRGLRDDEGPGMAEGDGPVLCIVGDVVALSPAFVERLDHDDMRSIRPNFINVI